MNSPRLTVIIVTWNVLEIVVNCIESIVEHARNIHLEIIVVDNASNDNTGAILSQRFPGLRVIVNDTNLGFARANNLGLQVAKGELVLFLNPDTIVMPFAFQRLIAIIESDSTIGLVGPRLLNLDGSTQHASARRKKTLWFVLFVLTLRLHRFPAIGRFFYYKFIEPYDFDVGQYVEAISGAAILGRREVFTDLRGFREEYIHGGEDLDLCARVLMKGLKIYYVPEAIITHLGGASSSQIRAESAFHSILSTKTYFLLNFGHIHSIIYTILTILHVPLFLANGLLKMIYYGERRDFDYRVSLAKRIYSRNMWR